MVPNGSKIVEHIIKLIICEELKRRECLLGAIMGFIKLSKSSPLFQFIFLVNGYTLPSCSPHP